MVVVDEAHAYRNPDTQRADVLRSSRRGGRRRTWCCSPRRRSTTACGTSTTCCATSSATTRRSPTPGIRSLRDHFARGDGRQDPEDLRRSSCSTCSTPWRCAAPGQFVKRYYPARRDPASDGDRVPHHVPAAPRSRKVDYDLDDVLPGFFDASPHALDVRRRDRAGARSPSERRRRTADAGPLRSLPLPPRADDADAHEVQLAGLLRSGLLKRFESSAVRVRATCRKMAESHEAFLALLDAGRGRHRRGARRVDRDRHGRGRGDPAPVDRHARADRAVRRGRLRADVGARPRRCSWTSPSGREHDRHGTRSEAGRARRAAGGDRAEARRKASARRTNATSAR